MAEDHDNSDYDENYNFEDGRNIDEASEYRFNVHTLRISVCASIASWLVVGAAAFGFIWQNSSRGIPMTWLDTLSEIAVFICYFIGLGSTLNQMLLSNIWDTRSWRAVFISFSACFIFTGVYTMVVEPVDGFMEPFALMATPFVGVGFEIYTGCFTKIGSCLMARLGQPKTKKTSLV